MLGHIPVLLSPLHYLVIGSTLLEYNVHHLANRTKGGPMWAPGAVRWHWAVSIVGLALCMYALPHLPLSVIIGCGVLGLISFAYSTPLLPFRYKRRLKDYGLVKIHVLTGVWVAVCTILPGLYWNIPFHTYWIEVIVRALLIFPLCIAFDIRDAEADLAIGINTLPNTLGIKAAYLAVNLTLCAFLLGGLIRCIYRHEPTEMAAYIISAAAAWFSIHLARRKPSPYVYLVLIDGVMLLYGVLQVIA
jgi:4-hydroxybenzoate polyprenyltransferase